MYMEYQAKCYGETDTARVKGYCICYRTPVRFMLYFENRTKNNSGILLEIQAHF